MGTVNGTALESNKNFRVSFDGGNPSSDGGLLLLMEFYYKLGVNSLIADRVEFPTSHKFMGAMIYSEAEVNLLLNKAKEAGEPIRAAITLAVCYGMRRSEVLGLRWKDIDFERKTLTVCNTVVQNGELRIEEERTKTAKSHRSIGLLPMTIPYLKELREKQSAAKLKTDKVVAWMDGQEVRPDFIYRKTRQLMKKCGLPVIRFHDLRHTAASLLAPHVTPKQLQEFLGHEDISTTYTCSGRSKERNDSGNEQCSERSVSHVKDFRPTLF